MAGKKQVRLGIIGCGGMARSHLHNILQQQDTTQVAAICEPSPQAYAAAAEIFQTAGLKPPPNQPDFSRFVNDFAGKLDAVFIITPHAYHHDQAAACLEVGWDVLLEKPMVMNAAEARSLIEVRDRTGKLLVVAFPGSLFAADSYRRENAAGERTRFDLEHQRGGLAELESGNDWKLAAAPEISGGGFLFDTGAHLLNTVADLAGENFVEVAAWMDNRGTPVDILSVVIGRLESGTLVTLNACGDAIPSCHSDIRVFCTQGILRTGVWGEMLEVQRSGRKRLSKIAVPPSLGVWEQFLDVRDGRMTNPGPAEIGLRMSLLWDAIQASAAKNGARVECSKQ